ncbi:MAG: hypothetical protein DSY90_09805 [Deltaproteobacteria bacterium]|nr:MAG: hypothetical protein DSY90_09805 [Deltaproteobacteria bacterium]
MASRHDLLQHTDSLITHITDTLGQNISALNGNHVDTPTSSSVLFLISQPRTSRYPWLLLNKRSRQVRQPGDLCFPGGGPSPRVDTVLAKCLSLPGLPFARWRSGIGRRFSGNGRMLSQLLATCLRESFEEMGLNPLGVRFLGPLPAQRLVLFDRVIYPMVGWIRSQTRFRLNGEVEKVIPISIGQLLNPGNYARFRITYPPGLSVTIKQQAQALPCFIHQGEKSRDILWGATYRMIMMFLSQVLDFIPPETDTLPEIDSPLSSAYFKN